MGKIGLSSCDIHLLRIPLHSYFLSLFHANVEYSLWICGDPFFLHGTWFPSSFSLVWAICCDPSMAFAWRSRNPSMTSLKVYVEHDFLVVSVLSEQSAVTPIWHLLHTSITSSNNVLLFFCVIFEFLKVVMHFITFATSLCWL